ncbi:hypothetical protein BC826DRAFT_973147 [Russula brevipes]|nr:hypothetical protein BC826DRAFT_973147 [Russula brevipes]
MTCGGGGGRASSDSGGGMRSPWRKRGANSGYANRPVAVAGARGARLLGSHEGNVHCDHASTCGAGPKRELWTAGSALRPALSPSRPDECLHEVKSVTAGEPSPRIGSRAQHMVQMGHRKGDMSIPSGWGKIQDKSEIIRVHATLDGARRVDHTLQVIVIVIEAQLQER